MRFRRLFPLLKSVAIASVVKLLLAMEAGNYTARISFRDDRSIAGLFILPEQTP